MIEVSRLSKSYRVSTRRTSSLLDSLRAVFVREFTEIDALCAVDWRVAAGETHALIGRNGSGKSTLIKILCGILHPTSGTASVGGRVPWENRREHVRRIGVVFGQKTQLTWELPALDSFALHRSLYGVPEREYAKTLDYLVDAFEAVITRPVRSLSLGERMKCEIICALLHRPALLFLDEPTIGLDLISKDQVRRAIRDVNEKLGTTVVLTSHDLSDVSSLCEQVSVLDRGRFLYQGKLESLLAASARQKTLKVKLERPLSECHLNGFPFTPTGEYTAALTLDGDASKLHELLPELLRELPIADLSVEAPELEQVVKALYRDQEAEN